MNRYRSLLTLAFLMLLTASPALAMRHPQLGGFMQRDPRGTHLDASHMYGAHSNRHVRHFPMVRGNSSLPNADREPRLLNLGQLQGMPGASSSDDVESRSPGAMQYYDGMSLYAYVGGNPVKYLDPSGLSMTIHSGVYVCGGGIHTYIDVDNKGYGLYALSHVRPGATWKDDLKALWAPGVVVNTDHGISNDCREIMLNSCFCPGNVFKLKMKSILQNEYNSYNLNGGNHRRYSAGGHLSVVGDNCHTWVDDRIKEALKQSCSQPRWWMDDTGAITQGWRATSTSWDIP